MNVGLRERGQALVEYSLIASLVSVALISVFMAFSSQISSLFNSLGDLLVTNGFEVTWVPEANPYEETYEDFQMLITDYYNSHGNWPSKKSPKNFTSIGLDPDDWSDPVDGILWIPKGNKIILQNAEDDNIQIYVNDADGNQVHLYDGWNIICPVTDTTCYYKKVAPGNEVDITTIEVVYE